MAPLVLSPLLQTDHSMADRSFMPQLKNLIIIRAHITICSSLLFFFFFFFEIADQVSILSCSCKPHHSFSNAGSLTHCDRLGIKPMPNQWPKPLQRQCQILSPLCHSKKSSSSFFFFNLMFYQSVISRVFVPK